MNAQEQRPPEEEGISPVVGAILMVAITVVLAAVILFFITGLADQPTAATAGFTTTSTPDGVQITLNSVGTADSIRLVAEGTVLHTWDKTDVGTSVTVTGVDPNTELTLVGTVEDSETVVQVVTPEQTYGAGPPSVVTPGPTAPPSDVVQQAFGLNPQKTSVSTGTHLSSTTGQVWVANDRAQLYNFDANFALDDEHAYTTREGTIFALNQSTGNEEWSQPYFNDRMRFHVTGGVLITSDNSGGDVSGLNKTDGSVEYTVSGHTSATFPVFHDEGAGEVGFVNSAGDYVIINSVDGSVEDTYSYPSGAVRAVADDGTTRYVLTENAVVAQDIGSGGTQWTYTSNVQSSEKGYIGVDSGQVFFQSGDGDSNTEATNERLRALDASSGALEWTAPDATARSGGGTVIAHPTVQLGDSYVYTRMDLDDDSFNDTDEWVALDKSSGTVAHTFGSSESVNFIESDDDLVVTDFGTDEVYTLTPGTWGQSNVISTPDGARVFPGENGELYMFVNDGIFGNNDVYKYES